MTAAATSPSPRRFGRMALVLRAAAGFAVEQIAEAAGMAVTKLQAKLARPELAKLVLGLRSLRPLPADYRAARLARRAARLLHAAVEEEDWAAQYFVLRERGNAVSVLVDKALRLLARLERVKLERRPAKPRPRKPKPIVSLSCPVTDLRDAAVNRFILKMREELIGADGWILRRQQAEHEAAHPAAAEPLAAGPGAPLWLPPLPPDPGELLRIGSIRLNPLLGPPAPEPELLPPTARPVREPDREPCREPWPADRGSATGLWCPGGPPRQLSAADADDPEPPPPRPPIAPAKALAYLDRAVEYHLGERPSEAQLEELRAGLLRLAGGRWKTLHELGCAIHDREWWPPPPDRSEYPAYAPRAIPYEWKPDR
jgi:hypothetical protein